VIRYHQKEYSLAEIPRDPIISSIRTPLICAIFRLIDECDISCRRTSSTLYDIIMEYAPLGTRSQKYWKAHLSTTSIVFKAKEIIIGVEDESKSRILINRLRKRLKEINEIFESYDFARLRLRVVTLSWS